MARRAPATQAATAAPPSAKAAELAREAGGVGFGAEDGPWLGERLRRLALGLTAALLCARAYWPSEAPTEADSGAGLIWVLLVLFVAGLAIASFALSGATRIRFSLADLAFYALIALVCLSTTRGADRRIAINLAWEWAGLGLAYALVRILPRTPGESSALAGALVATAVGVAAYGLYQAAVEFPQMHAAYKANKLAMLIQAGVTPGSPAEKAFEDRLLGSNEPFATFALANSLAGFVLGPLVLVVAVLLENLRASKTRGSPAFAIILAAVPALVLLGCLLLTKSRSAYIGLALGIVLLAWRERTRLSRRALVLASAGLLAVVVLLGVLAASVRHLDWKVLSESTKSLRYRTEYWQATLQMICNEPGVFWRGVGPGNFAGAYLKYKLPQSSEEIRDPHDLFLEVWATAGVGALIALVAAIVLVLRELLARTRDPDETADLVGGPEPSAGGPKPKRLPDAPPARVGWLLACAGVGGWAAVVVLGRVDPFGGLLARWLVLGAGWGLALLLGIALWKRQPLPAFGFGAGVLAVVVNLLAAGGIGIPSVALMLWMLVALGQNLREDRACGRPRVAGGRLAAYVLALAWAALVGTFYGNIMPYWKMENHLLEAEALMRARPPKFEQAREEYRLAHETDRYSVRPWLELADIEYQFWLSRGAQSDDQLWKVIMATYDGALQPPRNPSSLDVLRRKAMVARAILARVGGQMKPLEVVSLRGHMVKAAREATKLYPSDALLHAELALSSAQLGDYGGASSEATEALRLDKLTPHLNRKLPDDLRKRLQQALPDWTEQGEEQKRKSTESAPAKQGAGRP